MRAIRKTATIRELPSGWLWKEHGRIYKTAGAVLKAFKREDSKISLGSDFFIIRVTNWEPTTGAGLKILKAIGVN
jgi:hypothetical protein